MLHAQEGLCRAWHYGFAQNQTSVSRELLLPRVEALALAPASTPQAGDSPACPAGISGRQAKKADAEKSGCGQLSLLAHGELPGGCVLGHYGLSCIPPPIHVLRP